MKKRRLMVVALLLVLTAQPSLSEDGGAKQTFDESDRLIQEEYLDENDQRVLGEQGYACHTLEYDERGNWISRAERVHPDSAAVVVLRRTIKYQK